MKSLDLSTVNMNWPGNDTGNALCEALGIAYPIIQAPMAGGATTPELVAAVSNAGGLGSLGAGYMAPEAIREAIIAVRKFTDKPFAVNLLLPNGVTEDAERIQRANLLLAPYRDELGLPEPEPFATYTPNYTEQLGVLFEESVKIVSFAFGIPSPKEMESLKYQGITTLASATHLLEGLLLEESGIDIVVAQGAEAGGHRATFVGSFAQGLIGTMALVPLLAEHLSVPIIATGGIMNGRGIAAALALGASGAQLGTAFLACPESGIHPHYKKRLLEATELQTTLTRVFSGKPARGLKNRFTEELQDNEAFLPGYPIQNTLTRDILLAAAQQNRDELMSLWAGQGCALCRDRPARELIEQWVEQAASIISNST